MQLSISEKIGQPQRERTMVAIVPVRSMIALSTLFALKIASGFTQTDTMQSPVFPSVLIIAILIFFIWLTSPPQLGFAG